MMKLFFRFIILVVVFFVVYIGAVIYNQCTYILGATHGEAIDIEKNPECALLVIDIQNAYPDKKVLVTNPQLHEFITNTNKVIEHFNKQSDYIAYLAQIKKQTGIRSFFLPHIAVEGSKEAEIHSEIYREENPDVFTKFRADGFSNPYLQKYLNRHHVGRLYIVGMAAEVCVDQTIQGAINRGYQVYVVEDAVLAIFGEKSKMKRIRKYADLGARIITIADLYQSVK